MVFCFWEGNRDKNLRENLLFAFSVHKGLKGEVGEKAGEWFHIVLPNGLHGWVKREAVCII